MQHKGKPPVANANTGSPSMRLYPLNFLVPIYSNTKAFFCQPGKRFLSKISKTPKLSLCDLNSTSVFSLSLSVLFIIFSAFLHPLGIGKNVQNGWIEPEGVCLYIERWDSPVAKKAYKPLFMKENTKISVLSLFIYLLDYCFFCIFPAFFAVWAFFTSPEKTILN